MAANRSKSLLRSRSDSFSNHSGYSGSYCSSDSKLTQLFTQNSLSKKDFSKKTKGGGMHTSSERDNEPTPFEVHRALHSLSNDESTENDTIYPRSTKKVYTSSTKEKSGPFAVQMGAGPVNGLGQEDLLVLEFLAQEYSREPDNFTRRLVASCRIAMNEVRILIYHF